MEIRNLDLLIDMIMKKINDVEEIIAYREAARRHCETSIETYDRRANSCKDKLSEHAKYVSLINHKNRCINALSRYDNEIQYYKKTVTKLNETLEDLNNL